MCPGRTECQDYIIEILMRGWEETETYPIGSTVNRWKYGGITSARATRRILQLRW